MYVYPFLFDTLSSTEQVDTEIPVTLCHYRVSQYFFVQSLPRAFEPTVKNVVAFSVDFIVTIRSILN